jgi:hypothetical protein
MTHQFQALIIKMIYKVKKYQKSNYIILLFKKNNSCFSKGTRLVAICLRLLLQDHIYFSFLHHSFTLYLEEAKDTKRQQERKCQSTCFTSKNINKKEFEKKK